MTFLLILFQVRSSTVESAIDIFDINRCYFGVRESVKPKGRKCFNVEHLKSTTRLNKLIIVLDVLYNISGP